MSEQPTLQISNLSVAYGSEDIIADISLDVGPGSVVAVLGASGSGKSTLLRTVAGFVAPKAGDVCVAGRPVIQNGQDIVAAEGRGTGVIFQDYALFPTMTVRQNILFGIHREADREQRTDALLDLVGLSAGFAHRKPAELSGGQQQRVAIARALAPKPSVLLMDEPFANLDASLRQEMGREVLRILRAEGVSGLLVTHDRSEALGLADAVAVLGGQTANNPAGVLQFASPDEIYKRPNCAAVAELTGRANWVSGHVEGEIFVSAIGQIAMHVVGEHPNTAVIRPEQLRFTPIPNGTSRVCARRYTGATFEVHVETPAGLLVMDTSGDSPLAVGDVGAVAVVGACAVFDGG